MISYLFGRNTKAAWGAKSLFICLSSILFVFTLSAYGSTINVTCDGTAGPADHTAIQQAVDAATPGDVINLIGTCQLDGQEVSIKTSNITIQGAGPSNNWSTVVQGITDSGMPVSDDDYHYKNRGFRIGPTDSVISNVTIKNIKFQNFKWAVDVIPQISSSTNRCDSYVGSNGSGSNIVIQDNLFNNNWGSVEVLGASNNVQIKNNHITNAVHYDVVIWGLSPPHYCTGPQPSSLVSLGAPQDIKFTGNDNLNDQWYISLDVINSVNALVANNKLTNANGAEIVFMSGNSNALVTGNTFDGGGASTGFYISDAIFPNTPSPSSNNVKITNNQLNNTAVALFIDSSTQGISMIANQYSGNVFPELGDIVLCDDGSSGLCSGAGGKASSNNVVVGSSCTHVLDVGVNNKEVGLVSVSHDVNIPPATTCK